MVKQIGKTTVCYIVESGEENGWKYKKYSDGTFEAFTTFSANVARTGTGNVASGTADVPAYPQGVDVTEIFATLYGGNSESHWIGRTRPLGVAGRGTIAVLDNVARTNVINFSVHVHGTWL